MIAKAKAISHGINDLRYITGESQHKKHPEKIYRVLDNLLHSELDAMGIWNSMQLTLSQHRSIKNSVIRIELSLLLWFQTVFTPCFRWSGARFFVSLAPVTSVTRCKDTEFL